jgi:hypothetical protein
MTILIAALMAVLAGATVVPAADTPNVVATGDLSRYVAVRDVHETDGAVAGIVQNTSDRPVRNIELRVDHRWLWANEFRPGEDTMSRSGTIVVPGEIPPGGAARFSYRPDPPLPVRSDGHFQTVVEVKGLTRMESGGATSGFGAGQAAPIAPAAPPAETAPPPASSQAAPLVETVPAPADIPPPPVY